MKLLGQVPRFVDPNETVELTYFIDPVLPQFTLYDTISTGA